MSREVLVSDDAREDIEDGRDFMILVSQEWVITFRDAF